MTDEGLLASGLTVTFGSLTALRDVQLAAGHGRLLCVTGPSGAGKTTLLHVLAGVQQPAAGSVTLDGAPVVAGDRRVALVPQTCGLSPVLTALESVALPLQAAGVDREAARRRATEALETVGLSRVGRHLSNALSGGQQQRVAVARALACEAPVLLADEPTAELDADNRALVMRLLRARAEAGAVVVVASDDPAVTAECDGTLGLLDGAVVAAVMV